MRINRLRKLHKCETVETRISKSVYSIVSDMKVRALIAGISLRVSLRASLRDSRSPKALISRRVPPARGCWCEEDVTKRVRARACRKASYSAHASHHNGWRNEEILVCYIEAVGATERIKKGLARSAAAGRGPRSLKTLKRLRRRVSPGSDVKQLHNYRKTITPTSAEH